jgi:hypothetical protein
LIAGLIGTFGSIGKPGLDRFIRGRDTPGMEPILARIAAFLTFAGTAGMVAATLGYVAHDSLGVSRQMIREYAVITALLIGSLIIIGMFASTSGTRK